MNKNNMNLRKVSPVQDEDGHWYVIPTERIGEFQTDLENEGMIDSGDFGNKWSEFMTGGCLSLVQLWADI